MQTALSDSQLTGRGQRECNRLNDMNDPDDIRHSKRTSESKKKKKKFFKLVLLSLHCLNKRWLVDTVSDRSTGFELVLSSVDRWNDRSIHSLILGVLPIATPFRCLSLFIICLLVCVSVS